MVNRVAKLFPNEQFEENEQSVLMSTIRVPKNILYLSDRLPKPTYASASPESDKRRSTAHDLSYGLPDIPLARKPRLKKPRPAYGPSDGRALPEPRDNSNGDHDHDHDHDHDNDYAPPVVGVRGHNHRAPKSRKPDRPQLSDEASHNGKPKHSPNLPSPPHLQRAADYAGDETGKDKDQGKDRDRDKDKDKDKDNNREREKEAERDKLGELVPIYKVGMKQGKRGRSDEDRANEGYQNSPYIQDSYIHQLVGKRNPIIKPLNDNMKRIADIYSGNNAQHIISLHKR